MDEVEMADRNIPTKTIEKLWSQAKKPAPKANSLHDKLKSKKSMAESLEWEQKYLAEKVEKERKIAELQVALDRFASKIAQSSRPAVRGRPSPAGGWPPRGLVGGRCSGSGRAARPATARSRRGSRKSELNASFFLFRTAGQSLLHAGEVTYMILSAISFLLVL
jgi:hypothetical protein